MIVQRLLLLFTLGGMTGFDGFPDEEIYSFSREYNPRNTSSALPYMIPPGMHLPSNYTPPCTATILDLSQINFHAALLHPNIPYIATCTNLRALDLSYAPGNLDLTPLHKLPLLHYVDFTGTSATAWEIS